MTPIKILFTADISGSVGRRVASESLFDISDIFNHDIGGVAERHTVKNLRPDMTMVSHKLDISLWKDVGDIFFGLASFDRCTELAIDLTGRNFFISMRVDTGGYAKKYSLLFYTLNNIVVSSKDVLVNYSDLTAFYRYMMIQKK